MQSLAKINRTYITKSIRHNIKDDNVIFVTGLVMFEFSQHLHKANKYFTVLL